MPETTIETLLATRQPWVPDWPFVRPGVCLTYLGLNSVMLLHEGLTAESYEEYLVQIERSTRGAPDDVRGATIFHIHASTWWQSLSLREKTERLRAFAAIVAPYDEKLKRAVQVSATIATSVLARVALRTINAFHPPASPSSIVGTAEEGWRVVARTFPDLDTGTYLAAHAALVERHAPSLAATVYRNGLKRAG